MSLLTINGYDFLELNIDLFPLSSTVLIDLIWARAGFVILDFLLPLQPFNSIATFNHTLDIFSKDLAT